MLGLSAWRAEGMSMTVVCKVIKTGAEENKEQLPQSDMGVLGEVMGG